MKKYLLSCFLLVVPVLLWNVFLTSRLPAAYQPDVFTCDIPAFILMGENLSRTLLFLLMLFMPLSAKQRSAWILYLSGLIIYAVSWLLLICFPESRWSLSAAGFSAPAWTPAFWLAGIGLIGWKALEKRWVGLLYIFTSLAFLGFHCIHTFMVYNNIFDF